MERYLDNILIYHGDKQMIISLLSSNKGLVLKDIALSKDRLIGMEQTAQDIISVVDSQMLVQDILRLAKNWAS